MDWKVVAKYQLDQDAYGTHAPHLCYRTDGNNYFFICGDIKMYPGEALPPHRVGGSYDPQPVQYKCWTTWAAAFLKDIEAGKIRPVWIAQKHINCSVSSCNTECSESKHKCTCPSENFKFNGIGCQCKGC